MTEPTPDFDMRAHLLNEHGVSERGLEVWRSLTGDLGTAHVRIHAHDTSNRLDKRLSTTKEKA